MHTIIVISSRFIKLFANLAKMLCYPFHTVLPKKRFTLPERSAPLRKSRAATVIPRIVWQTNYTRHVTLPVYLNYQFNRLMSPRHELRFMTTEERQDFVAEYYPEALPYYQRLKIGAAQADFWRLLVLYHYGGVYMDIDAHAIWPLDRIIGKHHEILYVTTRRGMLSNYFIASVPHHPDLDRLIREIERNIRENVLENTHDITGPGVFNKVLDQETVSTVSYRLACHQGNFTNEYFQYIDKPAGKWHKEQRHTRVIGDP